MRPVPVFRALLPVAAGLALAGCRSCTVVPGFSAVAGRAAALPPPRVDSSAAVTTHKHAVGPPKPVNAAALSRGSRLLEQTSPERKPAGPPGSQQTLATIRPDTANRTRRPDARRMPPQRPAFRLLRAQPVVHYGLHFVFPLVLALVLFPALWPTAYLVMVATMLIDLDHLLATPVFDPSRCSIGYHPLHSGYALVVYALLLLVPAAQMVAVGLLFHLVTDTVDCLWNFRHCHECYLRSRFYAWRIAVRKLVGR